MSGISALSSGMPDEQNDINIEIPRKKCSLLTQSLLWHFPVAYHGRAVLEQLIFTGMVWVKLP